MNVKVVPINFTDDLEDLNIGAKSTRYVGIRETIAKKLRVVLKYIDSKLKKTRPK